MSVFQKNREAESVPSVKKKGRRKKLVAFVIAAALLCGTGVGVKALFFPMMKKWL